MTRGKKQSSEKAEESLGSKTRSADHEKDEDQHSEKSSTARDSGARKLNEDELLTAAKERGIQLPKDAEDRQAAVTDLIKLVAEHSEGQEVDQEAVLACLEHEFGLSAAASKKRKAEIDLRPDVGKKINVDREPVEWPLHDHGSSMRECSERLRLEAINKSIAIPEDDTEAIVLCGQAVAGAKTDRDTVDVMKALKHLQDKCGLDMTDKPRNLVGDVQVPENTRIVEMLRELANSYFKIGSKDRMNRIKGAMLQRAATAIRDLDWKVTPDHMPVENRRDEKHVPNVGHDTIAYIRELFETGKVARLEEHKIEDSK